jgi:hypothetical protein
MPLAAFNLSEATIVACLSRLIPPCDSRAWQNKVIFFHFVVTSDGRTTLQNAKCKLTGKISLVGYCTVVN